MKRIVTCIHVLLPFFVIHSSSAQISLTAIDAPYFQDFNTLASTGTSSALPSGWSLFETGSSANTLYTAGNGNTSNGDTWSYGTAGSSERSLGGMLTLGLVTTFGAQFVNNTGRNITALAISYRGECWRIGVRSRFDSLLLHISINATSLTTGSWTKYSNLSLATPDTSFGSGLGQRDGNAPSNQTLISGTIPNLNILPGSTFWIRWIDFDAVGQDDGLAVDDFSLTPISCSTPTLSATGGTLTCAVTSAILSASSNDPGATFAWSGPGIISGGQTQNPTVNASGVYTVTVTTSSGGCSASSIALVSEETNAPGASATGGSITCTMTTTILSATSTSGTNFSWAGPGIVSGGLTANPTVSSSGTYTVTVTNSTTSCTSTATASVTSNKVTPSCSLVAPSPRPICGSSGNVIAPSAVLNANTYLWSLSGSGWTLDSPADSIAARYSVGTGSATFKLVLTNTATGCKDSCTVTFECSGEQQLFCTIGQAQYGQPNGRFCDGRRRLAIIGQLLNGPALVVGKPSRSITITQADSQCIIDKLPGGGPSDILPAANYTFAANCGFTPSTPGMQLKNGRIHNLLLGQTIALGLNLRLGNGSLGSIVLTDRYMTTVASTGCDQRGTPIPGTESTVSISQSVLDALNSLYGSPTVTNLFDLGNRALGNMSTGGAGLNQISSSIGAIHEAFDGCRFLVGFSSSTPSSSRLITIEGTEEIPADYSLLMNYPNPFNPSTKVDYALPEPSTVTLKVYNMLGQVVATLVNETMTAGYHSTTWNAATNDGSPIASGFYVYRMQATSSSTGKQFTETRKMLLLK